MNTYQRKTWVVTAVEVKWANWNAICDFLPVPERGHGMEGYDDLRVFVWINPQGETYPHWESTVATEGQWLVKEGDTLAVYTADEFARQFAPVIVTGSLTSAKQQACWHTRGNWQTRPYVGQDILEWACADCGAILTQEQRANLDDGLTMDGNTAHG